MRPFLLYQLGVEIVAADKRCLSVAKSGQPNQWDSLWPKVLRENPGAFLKNGDMAEI